MMRKMALWTAGLLLLLTAASCAQSGRPDGRSGGQQNAGVQTEAETAASDPAAGKSESAATIAEKSEKSEKSEKTEKAGGETSAAAPAAGAEKTVWTVFPELVWQSQQLQLTHALDDGSVKSGNRKPEGKYVQIFMRCIGDGTLNWESVKRAQSDFLLRAADGTDYSASATGFQLQNTETVKINELEQQTFRGVSPIFDIPTDLHLDQLFLVVKDSDGSETASISLDGVPDRAPDDARS